MKKLEWCTKHNANIIIKSHNHILKYISRVNLLSVDFNSGRNATYRICQNFPEAKLLWLCTKHTIHWKTFAVHQTMAIMYCTQQVIQWKKFCKNRKSFPVRKVLPYAVLVIVWALVFCLTYVSPHIVGDM